jgi:DNA-binding beta-propeller fold protein YncE
MRVGRVLGCGVLALAACGKREIPRPPAAMAAAAVAVRPGPGERLRGASLLGTDLWGLTDGSSLTPDAAPGARLFELDPRLPSAPAFRAGGAVATALSPDGATLLVLTSGYNLIEDAHAYPPSYGWEYVFAYDVTRGVPRETQVIAFDNTFGGIAFSPDGSRFFVSGGPDDDVHELVRGGASGRWTEVPSPIPLGHLGGPGPGGLGDREGPYAAGLAVSPSGSLLAVVAHENDALTLVGTQTRRRSAEVGLVPRGVPGGEFPRAVVIVGEDHAYVASQRDHEVVDVSLVTPRVERRIPVGATPTALVVNRAGTRLYVADAGSDAVSVVDLVAGRELGRIPTTAPADAVSPDLAPLRGSNPNGLALSPDERTLYVTNGGNSTLAVIALDATGSAGHVTGLVPTGLYPNAVTVSRDGRWLYVANARSVPGPNRHGPWWDAHLAEDRPYAPNGGNEYSLQLEHGGLLAFPVPGDADLAKLTRQAIANDFPADLAHAPPVFQRLRGKVKHVVFVVAENRTYDQVFGDLRGADGDPSLLHWGERITPNHHALARGFVTLDRFFASGDVSGDGWQWTMAGRTTDVAEKGIPVQYGDRGKHTFDWEGMNRGINVGVATYEERVLSNPFTPPGELPGAIDVAAPDAMLWDAALAAGRSARTYGVFCDLTRYGLPDGDRARIPPLHMPAESQTRVAFPTRVSLAGIEDPYFRGFDMRFPDTWRLAEWRRELDGYVAAGEMPALSIVRLPHDHLGSFADAIDGVDTPDTQMADHDWAVGSLVEALSRTPFWESTVVAVVEDDAQNGSDHVNAHRTVALLAGPHVRRGAVVHTPYTTPGLLRTIELLLGLAPLGQHDAEAPAMEDALTEEADLTPYVAVVPDVLRSTKLPLPPPRPGEKAALPRHDAAWWAAATAGFDFDETDAAPAAAMNRALYCGLVDDRGCATRAPVMASVSPQ